MQNKELDEKQIDLLINVINLSSNIIKKDINDKKDKLNSVIKQLTNKTIDNMTPFQIENEINSINKNTNIPAIIRNELVGEFIKYNQLENYQKDIQDKLKEINKLKSANMSSEEKEKVSKILKGFFTENDGVEIKKGITDLRAVVKSTNTVKKINDKINRLNNELINRGILTNLGSQKNKKDKKQSNLEYKIYKLNKKKIKEESKQKIIMIKREEMIKKRNIKLSKLTQKYAKYVLEAKSQKKIDRLSKKLNKLKAKPIKLKSARRILFKEKIISLFTKKGEYDFRSWSKRRIDDYNKKSGKSL